MIIETILILGTSAAIYLMQRTNTIQNRKIKMLEDQNNRMSEALLLPAALEKDNVYLAHQWQVKATEIIYQSPFTMDFVKIEVAACNCCHLTHRYIVEGYQLARKKDLIDIEGFYQNGIKCPDKGCR